jgi:SAM-dependent methyltransferase
MTTYEQPTHRTGVDPLAHSGFGRGAAAYERGRPAYPRQAITWLAERLGIGSRSTVLDVGAGTGKLTRLMHEVTGASVVGVEPVGAMRAQMRAAAPETVTLDGQAEALPLHDTSVDAAVCGEAFHWFDGAVALAEIHRVLKANGGLGLVWNVHVWDRSAAWVRAIETLIAPYSDRRPAKRYTSGQWLRAFVGTELFGPLEQRSFAHEQRLDCDALVAHVASVAFIAALPEETRDPILAQLRRLFETDPTLSSAGGVTIRYRTDAYATRSRTIASE